MKEFISVNKRKIYTVLFLISLLVYYKVYWFLYSIIVSQFSLPIGTLSIIDFIFMFLFLLSAVPCSELLKRGILKFWKCKKLYISRNKKDHLSVELQLKWKVRGCFIY